MDKTEVVILVGSNHGSREAIIDAVMLRLSGLLDGFRRSPAIESPDAAGNAAPYLNAVCSGSVDCPLDKFTRLTKSLEMEWGRTAESKLTGIVEVDIDIVMWGGDVLRPREVSSDYFTIPFAALVTEG